MSTNEAVASIAALLTADEDDVLSNLVGPHDVRALDYTLESVKQIDALVDKLHRRNRDARKLWGIIPRAPDGSISNRIAGGQDFAKFVLRVGGYVGEAMRRSEPSYNWMKFDEWIATREKDKAILGEKASLGTAFILSSGDNACFPLGKVMKYVANGPEDSLYSFASVFVQLDRAPS